MRERSRSRTLATSGDSHTSGAIGDADDASSSSTARSSSLAAVFVVVAIFVVIIAIALSCLQARVRADCSERSQATPPPDLILAARFAALLVANSGALVEATRKQFAMRAACTHFFIVACMQPTFTPAANRQHSRLHTRSPPSFARSLAGTTLESAIDRDPRPRACARMRVAAY